MPKRNEVTGEWRKLHCEELYDFQYKSDAFRMIRLLKIRWAGLVIVRGRKEMYSGFLWGA
jgi:hypothetical protein